MVPVSGKGHIEYSEYHLLEDDNAVGKRIALKGLKAV